MIQSYKNLYSSYKNKNKKLIHLNFLRKFITPDSNVYIDKKTGIIRAASSCRNKKQKTTGIKYLKK